MLANRVRMGSGSEKFDPSTWEGIQNIVRKGVANEFFTVGDQIMALYDGVETVFEIIGIDVETPSDTRFTHSMTLQTKSCLYNMAFDSGDDNRYINSSIRAHLNNEFLTKLDTELSAVLGKVDKKVEKRSDLGGGQDDFSDKVFLISLAEFGTSGADYPFYDGANWRRTVKTLNGKSSRWWLRSPRGDYSNRVRIVLDDGGLYYYPADGRLGVAPACVII